MSKEILGQEENLSHIRVAAEHNMSVLLIGETGTGKTSMIQEEAKKHKRQSIRFNLTGETTVDEFVGKYTLRKGETVWEDGILLQAMKNGQWLIVDEINAALPEILFVLHSLLDDDKYVVVTNHNSEIVKPHKNFRFFATMNPVEEYAGTKTLNKAFMSRFQMILNIEYPPNEIEQQILMQRTGVDEDTAYKMVATAQLIRELKASDEIFYTLSTRDLIHWAELTQHMDPGVAFRVSIYNKSGADREMIAGAYKKIIGEFVKLELEDSVMFSPKALREEAKRLAKEKADIRKAVVKEVVQKVKDV